MRQSISKVQTLYVCFAIIILSSSISEARKYNDKSILYKRYPQLNNTMTPQCVQGINKMLINFLQYPYDQMELYSLKGINDLGSYSKCQQNLGQYSDYSTLNFNLSHLPLILHFGLCLPKECKQANLDKFNEAITDTINNAWIGLSNITNVESDYTKNWTRFQVQVLKTDEVLSSWRDETKIGCIIMLILASVFMLIFCFIPSLLHTKDKLINFKNPQANEQVLQNSSEVLSSQNHDNQSIHNNNINNSLFSTQGNMLNDKTKITVEKFNSSRLSNSAALLNGMSGSRNGNQSVDLRSSQASEQYLDKRALIDSNLDPKRPIYLQQTPKLIESFSWINAFKELKTSRGKPWDHKELDMLETFKFVSYVLLQVTATAFFLMTGPTQNSWKILDFFQNIIFTIVVSGNVGMEGFTCLSGFFGAYRLLQIYDANGGTISFKDILKFYARKVMRLLPIYYLVLFFGWFVGPILFDAPLWSINKTLYLNCESYWWASVLFIGNLVPFFGEATEGCMFWSWFLACDLQLYLLIPLYVALIRKSKIVGYGLQFLLIAFNIAFAIIICLQKELRAGVFALENYYLFSDLLNKPYCKFATHGTGVMFAFLYWEILAYRKCDNFEKPKKYPKLHFLHKAKWLGYSFNISGNALVWVNLLCGYGAVKSPYSWSMLQNSLYYGLTRISYSIALFLIFLAVILGHFEIGRIACQNNYMRALGKLTYLGGLLSPIVITLLYCGLEYSAYLTTPGVLYLGIGNILTLTIISFFVYLTFEYPFKVIIGASIMKKISHDDILRTKYLMDQGIVESNKNDDKNLEFQLKTKVID
ncbi:UNKNOWN [Stylonychia lemnae]|uniref:Acyltransferase 3 domain-containing protein n=1 Tax=Stylonychia lemnae TaxID=5949 RepID=A0A078ALZ5_STYLE|nr:UNKNOWN [Stylonychia lemnae]|eukprot:CDW83385.1 UNKNOWN [Stylonychia lemnae]